MHFWPADLAEKTLIALFFPDLGPSFVDTKEALPAAPLHLPCRKGTDHVHYSPQRTHCDGFRTALIGKARPGQQQADRGFARWLDEG